MVVPAAGGDSRGARRQAEGGPTLDERGRALSTRWQGHLGVLASHDCAIVGGAGHARCKAAGRHREEPEGWECYCHCHYTAADLRIR